MAVVVRDSTGDTMRRAALYLRVSTLEQTTVNQERELRAVAARMGCEIVAVHRDNGISGAKGRNGRPGFDALCKAANRREFDIIMAWSVDRLGRSLQDLVGFLSEIHALKIDLYLHQQGIDTTTPAGKAMFQMMGVFAEFERAMIAERVRAGMARAKSQGKHCGPEDRPRHGARCAGFPGQGQGHLQHPGPRCWRCHSSAHQGLKWLDRKDRRS